MAETTPTAPDPLQCVRCLLSLHDAYPGESVVVEPAVTVYKGAALCREHLVATFRPAVTPEATP